MGGGTFEITEKQLATIAEFQAKPKLTPKQSEELARLIAKRDAPPQLPKTAQKHLIDVYLSAKYNRREFKTNKYIRKGHEREEDSITLVSLMTGQLFEKNDVRLRNSYIQGEPDLFIGQAIDKADHTRDTKTCWSLRTFWNAIEESLDPMYKWQGVGYMDLTGSQSHTVDFCLVNATADALLLEKRRLEFDIPDKTSSAFIKEAQQLEINHIFDLESFYNEFPGFPFHNDIKKWAYDIPMEERHFAVTFQRDDAAIREMHDRVLECREWMETNLYSNAYLRAATDRPV